MVFISFIYPCLFSPFYPFTTTTPVSIPISHYRLDLTHLWTEGIRLNKGSSLDPLQNWTVGNMTEEQKRDTLNKCDYVVKSIYGRECGYDNDHGRPQWI